MLQARRQRLGSVGAALARAGFPPVLLTEVNFQALFEAQQAQQANGGSSPSGIITSPN